MPKEPNNACWRQILKNSSKIYSLRTGAEDTDITGTLIATDVADGLVDATIFTITSHPTNGSATINASTGAWTYTPNANYNGLDSFTVTITDDDNHTATQVISLTVTAVGNLKFDNLFDRYAFLYFFKMTQ